MAVTAKQPGPPDDLVAVGKISGFWGRRGMVKVAPLTDFPERLPEKGDVVLWRQDTGARTYRVTGGRLAERFITLELEGVTDIGAAEALKGSLVMVGEDRLEELPAGTFYRHQIVGLAVADGEGRHLGKVADIWATGAGDVYVIRGPSGEKLVPAVREFILKVDLDRREMTVRLPPEKEEARGEGER